MSTSDRRPHNVAILGESGVGKSSVFRMITGLEPPFTENKVLIGDVEYTIHDTPSVNPASVSNVTSQLRKKVANVGLILFCVRGRLKETTRLVHKKLRKLFQGKFAWVVVITGLENESDLHSWWDRNRSSFDSYGMRFDDHACVTAIKGKRDYFLAEFEESQRTIKEMIKKWCSLDTITFERKHSRLVRRIALLGSRTLLGNVFGSRQHLVVSPQSQSPSDIVFVGYSTLTEELNKFAHNHSSPENSKWHYKKGRSSISVSHSLGNENYTDAKTLVFVYATNNIESFEAIQQQRDTTGQKVIIVIGITGTGNERRVSVYDGFNWAKTLQAEFIEITEMDSSTLEGIFDFIVKNMTGGEPKQGLTTIVKRITSKEQSR